MHNDVGRVGDEKDFRFFRRYFEDSIDYPDPTTDFLGSGSDSDFIVTGREIGDGVALHYISHSFLAGWINYVQIVQARVLARYKDQGTPQELVAKYRERKEFHTNFLSIGDDVAILARDKSGRWWYFYYDQDVSDCSIGRFRTDDKDAEVLSLFEAFCGDDSEVIPIDLIHGWLS